MKSSTEAEVFNRSDYVPFNISILLFMEAQVYPLKLNVSYTDNQGTICMESNGRSSCTGNSCHIHIRYIFVKDKQNKGKFSIYYFLTWKMLANCF